MSQKNDRAGQLLQIIREVTERKGLASFNDVFFKAYGRFDMEYFDLSISMLHNIGVIDIIKEEGTYFIPLLEGEYYESQNW